MRHIGRQAKVKYLSRGPDGGIRKSGNDIAPHGQSIKPPTTDSIGCSVHRATNCFQFQPNRSVEDATQVIDSAQTAGRVFITFGGPPRAVGNSLTITALIRGARASSRNRLLTRAALIGAVTVR